MWQGSLVKARGRIGVVSADQIKSLDWRARKARRIASAPEEVVAEVLAKAQTLLE